MSSSDEETLHSYRYNGSYTDTGDSETESCDSDAVADYEDTPLTPARKIRNSFLQNVKDRYDDIASTVNDMWNIGSTSQGSWVYLIHNLSSDCDDFYYFTDYTVFYNFLIINWYWGKDANIHHLPLSVSSNHVLYIFYNGKNVRYWTDKERFLKYLRKGVDSGNSCIRTPERKASLLRDRVRVRYVLTKDFSDLLKE